MPVYDSLTNEIWWEPLLARVQVNVIATTFEILENVHKGKYSTSELEEQFSHCFEKVSSNLTCQALYKELVSFSNLMKNNQGSFFVIISNYYNSMANTLWDAYRFSRQPEFAYTSFEEAIELQKIIWVYILADDKDFLPLDEEKEFSLRKTMIKEKKSKNVRYNVASRYSESRIFLSYLGRAVRSAHGKNASRVNQIRQINKRVELKREIKSYAETLGWGVVSKQKMAIECLAKFKKSYKTIYEILTELKYPAKRTGKPVAKK